MFRISRETGRCYCASFEAIGDETSAFRGGIGPGPAASTNFTGSVGVGGSLQVSGNSRTGSLQVTGQSAFTATASFETDIRLQGSSLVDQIRSIVDTNVQLTRRIANLEAMFAAVGQRDCCGFNVSQWSAVVYNMTINDYNLYVSFIHPSGEYGYWLRTDVVPSRMLKLRLPAMTVVNAFNLNSSIIMATGPVTVDSIGRYAYIGSGRLHTGTPVVARFRLSDDRIDASVTVPGATNFLSAAVDNANEFLYLVGESAKVVKIRLSNMTVAGLMTLTGPAYLSDCQLSPASDFFYVVQYSNVASSLLTKITTSNFTVVSTVALPMLAWSMALDNNYAYVGTYHNNPARLVKVRLSDMTVVAMLDLPLNEVNVHSVTLHPTGNNIFCGVHGYAVQIKTSTMTRVGSITHVDMPAGTWTGGLISPDGNYAYFSAGLQGDVGKIVAFRVQ